MHNSDGPSAHELPSTKKLLKSTTLAAFVAGVLLITVVMPAEFGIDPTGIGNAIGLKRMGEIKVSLANEAAADKIADAKAVSVPPTVAQSVSTTPKPDTKDAPNDETTITLAPDQGREIKLTMDKGDKVTFSWSTDGGTANYDVHGDSKALNINYHSYSKGSEQTHQGEFEAAFDGSHGWFWRNRTSTPMTITLQTNGEYTAVKQF